MDQFGYQWRDVGDNRAPCLNLPPPSLLLTLVLASLSCATTAFIARSYLTDFFKSIRYRRFDFMPASISLGWFFSLAHTVYHLLIMPIIHHFSMAFMIFCMPNVLIGVINLMEEIKRIIFNQSQAVHREGLRTLFPQMSAYYDCSFLSNEAQQAREEDLQAIAFSPHTAATIRQGMVIKIKPGECFPADAHIILGSTLVDAAILTGEPQQAKECGEKIPAGAINLSHEVLIYANAPP